MSENSNLESPPWLNNSYLQDVLQKYLKDNKVKIIKVDIKPATSKGDNYASVMSRIKISFRTTETNKTPQELSFIMKYSFESDPIIADILNSYNFYKTEMKMYDQILPQLAGVLREIGDNEKLFAKTLKVDYEKSAIIFEDLSVNNYILADRLKGLDEIHARLTLKKVAKFHAAAAVLNQRLNGELEKFDRGIFNRHTRAFGCIFEYLTKVCANFAAKCPELGRYYHDKLINLKSHIVEYGTRAYRNNPKHFFTLNHGDLWINNMMMLYDSTEVEIKPLKDILLLDFQLCNWSSPAVDLHYFFNTSLEPKLHLDVHALNKLVQYYHGILAEMLRKFNYQGFIPTLHQFQVQMEEGRILALIASMANQAFMINDQCDDADFHSLVDDDERARNFRNSLYNNKRLQNNMKVLLPYYDSLGLLDLQK